jgi:glycosyltransferase involved in cell wall biosynthesis
MKICFYGCENLPVLAPEYNRHGIGGEQVQQTLLARALSQRGHEVGMVVYDYGQEDGASWHDVKTWKAYRADAGIPVLRFAHPRWTGAWSALRRADADVYYASCAGMHLGLLALFCQMTSRRLVFRLAHDTDCDPGQLLVRYWRDRKLYEYGLRRADCILAQSRGQQHALRENYGVPSMVADMIVDPPGPSLPRDIDVLWVNNLRDFKRPDLLLDLAAMLPQYRFHMVGGPQPGFSALYGDIRRRAASLPNVVFHGRVPYHEIGPLYARARVFVNTSDTEGFPNSYLQAWIRGTPVLAFFDPDSVIARRGLGCAVGATTEMRAAVSRMLEQPATREASALRCRAYMQAEHGEERILQPYLEAMRAVLRKAA